LCLTTLLPVTGKAVVGTFFNVRKIRQLFRCVAMTIDAVRHRKRIRLPHDIHLLDVAMARLAFDAFVDMHAMIEVRKIRHLVYAFPRQRLAFGVILCELDNFRLVLAGHAMAVHTGGNGGYHGMARSGHLRMAIFAVDRHRAGMKLMGKSDRLFGRIAYSIPFWPGNEVRHSKGTDCDEKDDGQANLQYIIEKRFLHSEPCLD